MKAFDTEANISSSGESNTFFATVAVVNYIQCCDRCTLFFILSVLYFQQVDLYYSFACEIEKPTLIEFLSPPWVFVGCDLITL